MARTAIVLFNLGGPDNLAAVRPFLFNLFNDPAIISLPQPFRWLLAQLISRRRAPIAQEIYEQLGGSSPLLAQTQDQATALETELSDLGEVRAFIAMRYWHPMSEQVVEQVKAWQPDNIVLLPLYPQFSTTTTGSSLNDWQRAAGRLAVPTRALCCYPVESELVAAQAELVEMDLAKAREFGKPRVLFSAHGLPKKIVDKGDPYQWQVEQTAAAVAARLEDGLDCQVCYQSRVGRLEWIGPSTEDEIARAGRDGVPLVVVPIAFVSEHSETLVELDVEYGELAKSKGIPGYFRTPALGTHPRFIKCLGDLVRRTAGRDGLCSHAGGRTCPGVWRGCPLPEIPA